MPVRGIQNVRRAIKDLTESANDDVRGVYFAGLQNIIESTPARSGLARNSWFLTVQKPSDGVRKQAAKSGSASLNQLSRMPKIVLGKILYLTNTADHINVLEYGGYPNPVKRGSFIDGRYQKLSENGFSKQAPGGFARKNLILMGKKIRSL